MDEVSRHLGIQAGQTTENYKFSLERVACFGSCALSPVVVVDKKVYGRMNPKKIKNILKEYE
jgi:NADH-quinone oxidoreductase subunit E